jgi:hypothetical protein
MGLEQLDRWTCDGCRTVFESVTGKHPDGWSTVIFHQANPQQFCEECSGRIRDVIKDIRAADWWTVLP